MPKINKRKISRVLENMGKRVKDNHEMVNAYGSLDIKKFNELSEVIAAHAELKSLGVKDSQHLTKLGFVPAGMVMKF